MASEKKANPSINIDISKETFEAAVLPVIPKIDEANIPFSPIVQYCKVCKKIVQGISSKNGAQFQCPVCKEQNIPYGTEKSIRSHFRIKEEIN